MAAYSSLLLCLLALFVGALIPVQAASNAALSKVAGGIAYPSIILFAVALTVAVTFALLTRATVPALSALGSAPRYGYMGGFIVASYVLAITFLAPKLGVGTAIAFVVTGQIVSSALIDQFGLFNAAVAELTPKRLLGMAMMIVGAFLAKKL